MALEKKEARLPPIFSPLVLSLPSHIDLNKMKHRNRLRISTLNSPVQFNVPQKFYEFKPNPELLKTCVNAMNTL